jgi:O-antigen ligase
MKLLPKDKHHAIHAYLLAAIVLLLPLSIKWSTWAIILCTINWLVSGNLIEKSKTVLQNRYAQLLLVLFFLHALSFFFSNNKAEAVAIIERRGAFFVLPFLILGTDLSNGVIRKIGLSFVCGVLAAFSMCGAYSIIIFSKTYASSAFFYHDFTKILDANAVYMAAYCILAIHVLLYYKEELAKKIFWLTITALLVFLVLLSSKMMFFILCVSLIVYSFRKLSKKNATLTSAAVCVVIVAVLLVVPKMRQRIQFELTTNLEVLHQEKFRYDTHFTGASVRLLFWKHAFSIQNEKQSWLMGVSTGDFQDLLNEKYRKTGMYVGNPDLKDTGYLGYGSHNQYIEMMLSLGLFGLIAFCYALFYYAKSALRQGNYLGMQLILLFSVFFISESALGTQKGIVAFTFFSLLFLQLNQQNSLDKKKSTKFNGSN